MEKYVIILLCKVGDFMSDFNSKEFGNKLRELRKSKGLSQENLATKLNISRTTIGRFENGEMIPNAQIIKELFPTRSIVGIDCRALIKQHGSLHCITMQLIKGTF